MPGVGQGGAGHPRGFSCVQWLQPRSSCAHLHPRGVLDATGIRQMLSLHGGGVTEAGGSCKKPLATRSNGTGKESRRDGFLNVFRYL